MGSLSIVIMLFVVKRTVGLAEAGVYSLAISVGQQFQTLGMYEVRSYQATDVRFRVSFGTYLATRLMTVFAMIVGIAAYAVHSGATASAIVLIFLVASLRVFDAVEDVFYAEFQREEHLDIGARASFLRVLVTTTTFAGALAFSRDLLTATVTALCFSLVASALTHIPPARRLFSLTPNWSLGPIKELLLACLPLFLSSFMSMYLANAPRFAIDQFLSEDSQGYFAILYMPATAINLLALLVFRPLLTRMATQWVEANYREFTSIVSKGLRSALFAFVAIAAACYLFGIPLLGWIFNEDLSGFLPELLVLVAGGAFNAAGVVCYYALTTMRRQYLVFFGYVIASISITALSGVLVPRLELLGAAFAYSVAMLILLVFFFAIMLTSIRRASR